MGCLRGAEVGSSTERAYMEAFHIPQSHRGRRKARSMHRFQYILDSEVTPWVLKPTSYRAKVCNQQSTLRRTASTIQRGTEQSTEGCTWSTWQQQVHFIRAPKGRAAWNLEKEVKLFCVWLLLHVSNNMALRKQFGLIRMSGHFRDKDMPSNYPVSRIIYRACEV